MEVKIVDTPINLEETIQLAFHPEAGGIDVFIGTVRNQTRGKKVLQLEFEAYVPMAIKEMQKIATNACERWDILKISIVHRTGTLKVGEIPVVIVVSTPHRKDAFEACKYIIDTLKETVPIWKKEFFEDGEIWVNAHP